MCLTRGGVVIIRPTGAKQVDAGKENARVTRSLTMYEEAEGRGDVALGFYLTNVL